MCRDAGYLTIVKLSVLGLECWPLAFAATTTTE
jgi:hypothetical protein